MRALQQNWRRTRLRLARMSRPMRLATAVLGGLVLLGAVWLATGETGTGDGAEVAMSVGEDRGASLHLLRAAEIPARIEDGTLLVPASVASEAQSLLDQEAALSGEATVSALAELADENDLWRTEAQNNKRWQVAKMGALSKLISAFPAVRSATVLFEPGSPQKLGAAGVAPTASVSVRLQAGASMQPKLVGAIADLVAGSIAGMGRDDVRVVDSKGRSYRLNDDAAAGALERRTLTEDYYRDKVQEALAYVDGAVVSVHAATGPDGELTPQVSLCVPRSYLAAVYESEFGKRPEADGQEWEQFVRPHLDRLRGAVVGAIGADAPAAVTVDWYYDVQPRRLAADDTMVETAPAGSAWLLLLSVLCGLVGLGALAVAMHPRLLWGRRRREREEPPEPPQAQRRDEPGGPYALVEQMTDDALLALIRSEHPQAVALILANLSPARAARVLEDLPAHERVEVARRIAGLGEIDPEVAAEVERDLAARFHAEGTGKSDGLAAVARILRHADYDTEQSVLQELTHEEPILAASLRKQMLVFEDIALLTPRLLGEALEAIDPGELAVALRTAGEAVVERVFASLSPAAAARLREEMERIGPVRLSDVEAAQMRVAEVVRRFDGGKYIATGEPRDSEILA